MENKNRFQSPRLIITKIKKNGKKIRLQPWICVYVLQDLDLDIRQHLYFSLNGRFLNAVRRNRIKRMFRAAWRGLPEGTHGYVCLIKKLSAEERQKLDQMTSTQVYKLLKSYEFGKSSKN